MKFVIFTIFVMIAVAVAYEKGENIDISTLECMPLSLPVCISIAFMYNMKDNHFSYIINILTKKMREMNLELRNSRSTFYV